MIQNRQLALPSYLVAATLFFVPVFDALMSVAPPHVRDVRWRFGALGLLSNAAMLPAIGVLIAFAAAFAFEHRRALRVMGWVAIAIALFECAMLALFVLDAAQTRASVRPQMYSSFAVASVTAVGKMLIGIVTFLAFGLVGARASIAREHAGAAQLPTFKAVMLPARRGTVAPERSAPPA